MDAPVAVNDTVTVEMNLMSDIDVLANDTDADNPYQPQVLTLMGITSPTSGTASIVANQIRYTPNALYLGPDTIEYVIQYQDGNISNTGIVSITVSTTNQPPTTQSGSYILDEDTSITQTLSGSDLDGAAVTFVLDTDVTHGTLTLSSTGQFAYIPDPNYHGTDSFTFHVTDGVFNSAVETVTFTIVSVNDAPVAVDDSFTANEDTFMDIDPMQNDSDVDVGDTFLLNSVSTPLHGSAVITG
jgi:VCBS repeat-containing protein